MLGQEDCSLKILLFSCLVDGMAISSNILEAILNKSHLLDMQAMQSDFSEFHSLITML